ncbi:MAG TPA: 3-phosphoshikimate 1-carboxyvinyltransferase [Syntrophomonadaceae bacterium]|nr:3-phosphoshikimate 1-carboxyvinyltransferase [Syntrophomonadaceae bacterium]
MEIIKEQITPLLGEIVVAPDKSISHRAIIFSALASGKGVVRNFLRAGDTLSTCGCIRALGVEIVDQGEVVMVAGRGIHSLREPQGILDCGNSGTCMRLLTGLTAGQPFQSLLSGDQSLNQRPIKRVIDPLSLMGADISARGNGSLPPLAVRGRKSLHGITYKLPVASAQVKSAIMLAGLFADGETRLLEPQKSRDHSERMLTAMGADIDVQELNIALRPVENLVPQEFLVPGDISSAAFFLVAATVVPGSQLMIRNVGLNPTRSGLLEVLLAMGARITIENHRTIGGEPIGDLYVKSADLHACQVEGDIIPRLIDEIPILAVAMALAQGESMVRNASELRVKESDRITTVCSELSKMGVVIEELEDGFIIQGQPEGLLGAEVESHGDHRIAMSLAVAGLCARGETRIINSEVVDISFPEFWPLLQRLTYRQSG